MGGVVYKSLLEEIDSIVVESLDCLLEILSVPLRERRLVVGQTADSGPDGLVRGTKQAVISGIETQHSPEDAEDLVNLRVTGEQRLAHGHLGKDTANGPHVNGRRVMTRAEKDFGGAVPKGDNLGSVVCTEGVCVRCVCLDPEVRGRWKMQDCLRQA